MPNIVSAKKRVQVAKIKTLRNNMIRSSYKSAIRKFEEALLTKDLNLFDIKQLKLSESTERIYYRIRKGKYRSIFYLENKDIYVIALDKREEVYKRWQ